MSRFVQGLVAGAALTAATLVGYAYGSERQAAHAMEGESQAAPEATSCRISVGTGRITAGFQCRSNQVMVGIQSNMLLCADVAVYCLPQ